MEQKHIKKKQLLLSGTKATDLNAIKTFETEKIRKWKKIFKQILFFDKTFKFCFLVLP